MNLLSTHPATAIARGLGALLLPMLAAFFALAPVAQAAQTDIASTPIVSTNAAAVKPNIMLLMDASDSMGWTHMPDEIESVTGIGSVGYKSAQCNILYYDPNQSYLLPKKADGTFFPTPAFNAARYAGFGDYYVTKDVTNVDLGSGFQAYKGTSLQIGGSDDTPQAAYYYKHSSATALNYAAAPCTDADTGATRPATGGGTWTKVVVGSSTGVSPHVDERQNFAIWYSFYRTRIALTKSAASLAFTPLTDTFRVGFITVQPKINAGDMAISQSKYLKIDDFTVAQRTKWFDKLFSQSPAGASPAREGLARVGRHFAGRNDSINKGMDEDPLQYSCQQNFTIMTTDGYWNTQTETPNSGGLKGGPLKIDGTTLVGQADGDLSDGYSPRPIWDGNAAVTEVVQDAWNTYDQLACGLPTLFRTTFRTLQTRDWYTKSFTKTQRRTQTWNTTTDQDIAATTRITKTQTKTKKTTEQYTITTHAVQEERYKVEKSTYQSSKTTKQLTSTSVQAQQRQSQTTKKETQQKETSVQYVLAKSQQTKTTVQNFEEKRRYSVEKIQKLRHDYRIVTKPKTGETYSPTKTCTPSATVDCKTIEVSGPAAVDSDSCVAGQSNNSPYVITECTSGSQTAAKTTTASCTVGTQKSGSPDYVTTICTDDQLQAPQAAATCTAGTAGDNTRTICTKPAGANNEVTVGVASCTANAGTAAPYVKTTCTFDAGPNNATTYPNSCTVGTTIDAQNVTSTCSRPSPSTNYVDKLVASCTPSTSATNQVITCSAVITTFNTANVDPATCTSPNGTPTAVGNVMRTCTNVPIGSYPTYVNVQSCAAGTSPSPDFTKTECSYPTASNYTNKALAINTSCSAQSAQNSNGWRSITCDYLAGANNTTAFVAPNTCTTNAGTASPFVKVDCVNSAQLSSPTVVSPASCTPFGDTTGPAPGYIVTRCTKVQLQPPTTSGTCVNGNSGAPNYIETVCSNADATNPSPPCTIGTTGPSWNSVTCSKPAGANNTADLPVAFGTCTANNGATSPYIKTTCNAPVTFGPAVVHPNDCTAGTDAANEMQYTSCVSNPAGTYATPAFVASCTNGVAADFTITTCTKGAATNATPQPADPCTSGTTTSGAPNYIETTCVATDVTDYTAGPTACTATNVKGKIVTCNTQPSKADEKSATCAAGTTTGAQPETTSCAKTTTAAIEVAPCSSSVDTANKENITCTKTPVSGPTQDAGCTAGTLAGSPYTITECASGAGSGYKLRLTTTTTTTTSKKSGSVVVGTPTSTSSTGSTAELTACLAPTDPAVALPSPNPKHATNNPAPPGTCTTWPCLISTTTVPGGSSNSLADVAQYYYKTDLRSDNTTWPNNVKPVGTGAEDDSATHQHMTTFVVGLGVSGTLNFRSDYRSTAAATGDFANIRCPSGSNCLSWPVWPNPAVAQDASGNYANTDDYNNPKSIDDFWHTAVNGRGTYFSAKNPASVISGLGDALIAIDVQTASGAGDAASSFEPVAGNNFVYTSSYQTGAWTGNLEAFTINLTTGALDPTRVWSAKDLLDAKTSAACDNRNIYLLHPGGQVPVGSGHAIADLGGGQNLVDFALDSYACNGSGAPSGSPRNGLDATEKAAFGNAKVMLFDHYPNMTDGSSGTVNQRTPAGADAKLLNFIRGQRGNEDFQSNVVDKLYRKRSNVLGDLVGSQPVYVGAPFARYQDTGYASFQSANANRTPMVYVGGNDGMLHAFDAATGQEAWAIIPQTVLGNLYKLADAFYKNKHQFFVDGSPVVSDVYDGTNWRTILVGGLNAGGKGYYALDVTNPKAPKGLWEFKATTGSCTLPAAGQKSDCNLGLTFGKPVITKVNGTWVVLFGSGYNNINGSGNDGGGFVYSLNALTGAIVDKIDTGVGTASDPAGLAQLNNFVDNTLVDNTTVRAYGGDLLGNIWRFNFSPSPSAQKIGQARDAANKAQPITTRPEVAEIDDQPIIFVGTGKLLGSTDVTDTQTQSLYAIVDPLNSTTFADLRQSLRPVVMKQKITSTLDPAFDPKAPRTTVCTDTVACKRTAGWFVDFPEAGERINVSMSLNFGTLIAASNVPQAASCTVGGHSWFNYFDFRTGAAVDGADFLTTGDTNSGQVVSQYIAGSLVAGFNIYKLPAPGYGNGSGSNNGKFVVGFHQSDTSHPNGSAPPPNPPPQGRRISWREITQ